MLLSGATGPFKGWETLHQTHGTKDNFSSMISFPTVNRIARFENCEFTTSADVLGPLLSFKQQGGGGERVKKLKEGKRKK